MSTKKTIYNVPVADRHHCSECGMPGAGFTVGIPDRALCQSCVQRLRAEANAAEDAALERLGLDDPEVDASSEAVS